MRRSIIALAVFLGAVFLAAHGSPLEPVKPRVADVGPFRRVVESRVFRAGQAAKVIGVGNDRTYLGLYLYDSYGNCLAWDDQGNSSIKDDIAVEWFPVHNEPYTYEFRNQGSGFNSLDMAVR
jgi:hypothetical protein